jgi:hypothetical protein
MYRRQPYKVPKTSFRKSYKPKNPYFIDIKFADNALTLVRKKLGKPIEELFKLEPVLVRIASIVEWIKSKPMNNININHAEELNSLNEIEKLEYISKVKRTLEQIQIDLFYEWKEIKSYILLNY